MVTVIIFIAILSLLVFVHELGHFWTARKMGMKVDEFGFGFPPKAWSIKKGETEYSINWLPLGGFVRIKGEDGSHRDDEDSFASKKPWKRFLVLVAGVVMNFITAGFLLSIGFMWGLPQALDGIDESAQVSNAQVQVVDVVEGQPADEAGLQRGDAIVKFNDQEITSTQQLIDLADAHVDEVVAFTITRGDETFTQDIPIEVLESTGRGGIGIALLESGVVQYNPLVSLWKGFEAAALITVQIVVAFYSIIKSLLVGAGPGMELSGPVGIAVMTGQVAELGVAYLLQFTAMLSLNLAVINILPFPALDGGRIVFVILEKFRGRPVSKTIEGWFHATGFALLMLLIIVVTFQDVTKLFN